MIWNRWWAFVIASCVAVLPFIWMHLANTPPTTSQELHLDRSLISFGELHYQFALKATSWIPTTPVPENITCEPPLFESCGDPHDPALGLRLNITGYDIEPIAPFARVDADGVIHPNCSDNIMEIRQHGSRQWDPLSHSNVTMLKGEYAWIRCGSTVNAVVRNSGGVKPAVNSTSGPSRPHVLIYMIDSISRYHFVRSMPQSRRFLESMQQHYQYSLFNFTNSNTVGPVSAVNKCALYAGVEDWKHHVLPRGSTLWEAARNSGYLSMMGENECGGRGNPRSPQSYNGGSIMRRMSDGLLLDYVFPQPLYCDMEDSPKPPEFMLESTFCSAGSRRVFPSKRTNTLYGSPGWGMNSVCIGYRHSSDFLADYYLDFRSDRVSGSAPTFSSLTAYDGHDATSSLTYILDKPFKRQLERLGEAGVFNDTIVLVISDHGIHFGDWSKSERGKVENAAFLLNVMVPNHYKDTQWLSMLRNNERRMVTPYDLFQTLLEMMGGTPDINKPGVSLVSQLVPYNRTCRDVLIAPMNCLCESWVSLRVDWNKELAVRIARAVIGQMNRLISEMAPLVCRPLRLRSVIELSQKGDNYLIQFTTLSPQFPRNPSLFEAGVTLSPGNNTIIMQGEFKQITEFAQRQVSCEEALSKSGLRKHYCECLPPKKKDQTENAEQEVNLRSKREWEVKDDVGKEVTKDIEKEVKGK